MPLGAPTAHRPRRDPEPRWTPAARQYWSLWRARKLADFFLILRFSGERKFEVKISLSSSAAKRVMFNQHYAFHMFEDIRPLGSFCVYHCFGMERALGVLCRVASDNREPQNWRFNIS